MSRTNLNASGSQHDDQRDVSEVMLEMGYTRLPLQNLFKSPARSECYACRGVGEACIVPALQWTTSGWIRLQCIRCVQPQHCTSCCVHDNTAVKDGVPGLWVPQSSKDGRVAALIALRPSGLAYEGTAADQGPSNVRSENDEEAFDSNDQDNDTEDGSVVELGTSDIALAEASGVFVENDSGGHGHISDVVLETLSRAIQKRIGKFHNSFKIARDAVTAERRDEVAASETEHTKNCEVIEALDTETAALQKQLATLQKEIDTAYETKRVLSQQRASAERSGKRAIRELEGVREQARPVIKRLRLSITESKDTGGIDLKALNELSTELDTFETRFSAIQK